MENADSSAKGQFLNHPMQPVVEFLQGGDPVLICNKYGLTRDELDKRVHSYQSSRRQMALADHLMSYGQVGRNSACPCGSGKKYKKCCLPKHEEARKTVPPDKLQRMEELARARENLEKDVQKGFDLLFSQDYIKAGRLVTRVLETHPEDDRLHDIAMNVALATGDYDTAFHLCRSRWQVSIEEKDYFQENGYHKREGLDRDKIVYFYSPSTWLEKFWIASRARTYREVYIQEDNARISKLVDGLKAANDVRRFSGREEEGYEMRKHALSPVLAQLEGEGSAAIPYLLPLTYAFSWASLFVPDLLLSYGTNECIRLLAELSMFRFPYFAQKCLTNIEVFGDKVVPVIQDLLDRDNAFDELKVGLIQVLGSIQSPESFAILVKLTDHENPYIVNWVAQALGRQKNPAALAYLEKAKGRLGELSKIAGAIRDLAGLKDAS